MGEPVKRLQLGNPASVDKALRQWQVLGVPIRSLVVQDTWVRWQRRPAARRAPNC